MLWRGIVFLVITAFLVYVDYKRRTRRFIPFVF